MSQTEWPEIPAECQKEAVRLIENFKDRCRDAAEIAIDSLYSEILPHIEGDLQQNWRSKLCSALESRVRYGIAEKSEEFWAQRVREMIFLEHREALEHGLIADLTRDRDEWKKRYLEYSRIT